MKKNEHYFPTIEYIKDPKVPGSWKVQTYENGEPHEGAEGNVPLEGMLLVWSKLMACNVDATYEAVMDIGWWQGMSGNSYGRRLLLIMQSIREKLH